MTSNGYATSYSVQVVELLHATEDRLTHATRLLARVCRIVTDVGGYMVPEDQAAMSEARAFLGEAGR